MAADKKKAPRAETPEHEAPQEAQAPSDADAPDNQSSGATLSALGNVHAGTLSATGSVIGMASVDGDASIAASVTPVVLGKGKTEIRQSYASAIIVGGGANTSVHQAGAPLIVGKSVDMSQSGGGVLITGEADVKRSTVGVVISPKTTLSEDSRLLMSTGAAIAIAVGLLTGLGLVAAVIALSMQRTTSSPPAIPTFSLPDLSALREKLEQLFGTE